jgi:hypothetical protein
MPDNGENMIVFTSFFGEIFNQVNQDNNQNYGNLLGDHTGLKLYFEFVNLTTSLLSVLVIYMATEK